MTVDSLGVVGSELQLARLVAECRPTVVHAMIRQQRYVKPD